MWCIEKSGSHGAKCGRGYFILVVNRRNDRLVDIKSSEMKVLDERFATAVVLGRWGWCWRVVVRELLPGRVRL